MLCLYIGVVVYFFFFKQKTAYEMRISDWSSDVCSSDLTLGILIPPSINMIVYGVLTETSIPQLYLAGLLPGLMLAGLFMLTVFLGCIINPEDRKSVV